jgi:pyridoxine kinase
MTAKKPAIIVISSHVVRGTVGNRAAAFALEVMGYPVWCVPTVTLPWHPGHGPSTRMVPDDQEFAAMLDDLAKSPWLGEVGAILTGYLGSAGQVTPVGRLISALKVTNPSAVYALDPVIGDGDSLYVGEEQALGIKDQLLPLCDLVTPNVFELGWLSGVGKLQTLQLVEVSARALGERQVLVTSAPTLIKHTTGNLLFSDEKTISAEHRAIDGPPNGLGDLTAALMLGHLLAGLEASAALEATTASVHDVMLASAQAGRDELALEQNIGSLLRPRAQIQMRTLVSGRKTNSVSRLI